MSELDLAGKRVLLREDLNVPMDNGRITSDERIKRALPTIRQLQKQRARVMVMSHLGRPKEGEFDEALSLEPVADALSKELGQEVRFIEDWINRVNVDPGEVVLLENVRFLLGEIDNDPTLAQQIAKLCDVFVMDAFATAHRAQASTVGVAKYAPIACAGPLLLEEVGALENALTNPALPLIAVVGGSKVSSKIHLLESLLTKVDTLIVGGGMANTVLAAAGYPIGKSLFEEDQLSVAKRFLKHAKARDVNVPLPTDVLVAKQFSADAKPMSRSIAEVADDDIILDVGPQTAATYFPMMQTAGTIIWNGPVGVFEFPAFSQGTRALSEAIADSHAFSIAGGGDTLAAIAQFNLHNKISYICTGGGAFLEYLQGDKLPGIAMLEKRARKYV